MKWVVKKLFTTFMFHSSTTIWQKTPPVKSFAKEARLCHAIGWWGGLKLATKGAAKGVGTISKYGWKFSSFPRTVLSLPFKAVWASGKLVARGVDATEFTGRYGENIGKVGLKTIGKGFLAPSMGPGKFLYRTMYKNPELICKGIANLPGEVLTTHKRIGAGIAETRNDVVTSLKNMVAPGTYNPLKILNNTRKFATTALKSPFKAVFQDIGWETIKPFVPTKVMANTVGAYGEFPKALYNTYKGDHFRQGWAEAKGTYEKTQKEMGNDARWLNPKSMINKFGGKAKEVATKNAEGFRKKYMNFAGMTAAPAAAPAGP